MMQHRFSDTAYGLSTQGGDWRDHALCRDEDPEIFFALSERGTLGGAHTAALVEEAKAVCARCLVSGDCLKWAVAVGDRWAVLGGTTPGERKQLLTDGALATDYAPEPQEPEWCANGHLVSDKNTYMRPNGTTECRVCRNTSYAPKQREKAGA